MNKKAIDFIKNFSFTLSSNLINLLISSLVILIVPKLIGVEEYGYWQLYLFYSTYVGLLHFGWNDGIYLKLGGERYKNLNKNLYFSQFYMLLFFQIAVAVVVLIIANVYVNDLNKIFIFKMIAFCIVITNTRFMLLYILQATNRFKEYAGIIISEKLIYFFLILLLLSIGVNDYKFLIFLDLVGRSVSLLIAFYFCKEIIFRKINNFHFYLKETLNNISIGVKLLLANIASLLVIGNVRFGIENSWDVETFGEISLMLSLVNFVLIFISASGIVLFPFLRRSNQEILPSVYITIKTLLMMFIFGTLIIYFPLNFFLVSWLPAYSHSLIYLSLIFPIIVYEGKMSLLINTYLKALRKEKLLLKINLLSFFMSLFTTYLTTIIFKDLNFAVLSILILLAFRSIVAEVLLTKLLSISIKKDLILETFLIALFVWSTWHFQMILAAVVYLISFFAYLIIKAKDIKEANKMISSLIKLK